MTDTVETAEEQPQYDFDSSFQEKIISQMLHDSHFALRSQDLIKPEYFTEEAAGALVSVLQAHIETYKASPDPRTLPLLLRDAFDSNRIRQDMRKDVIGLAKKAMGTPTKGPSGFVLDKIRDFARHQAVENAIMQSLPALEKGNWDKIEQLMRGALSVGSDTSSQDYDYWKEIDNRTQYREDVRDGKIVKRGITTGYSGIDAYLYHLGWGRRELSCLMGAAKAGKSLGLGDFTKNASLAGFNTFYGSLEVSSIIISDRIDAALSDTMIKNLNVDPAKVQSLLKAQEAKARKNGKGEFRMRDFPSGTLKPSILQRVLEDYKADGISFDLITIDYADIMAANYRSDSLIENLRSIYVDLRALAYEFDAAMLTATQTNRSGAKAMTAKATDVGDDFNKARTVDILIGINATDDEKAAGEARLYWALSRNTVDGFVLRIQQDRQKMKFLTKILGVEYP